MALLILITYVCLLALAFLIVRSIQTALKSLPAGHGSAPVHPARPFWDVLDLVMLTKTLYAAYDGTLHLLERDTFERLSILKGCTIRTMAWNRVGSPTIVTQDPVNVNTILVSQFADFLVGGRRSSLEPLLGHQILSLDGEAWKQSRGKLRPAVNRERVSDLNVYEKHTVALLAEIDRQVQRGSDTINLQPLFESYSLRISMDFFGLTDKTSEMVDEDARLFASAFDSAQAVLVRRVLLGNLHWLADSFAFRKACKTCHDLVDRKAMPVWKRVHALKDTNLESQALGPANKLFDELVQVTGSYPQLRSDVLGLIIATRDNSAALLAWIFYYLARYPETYYLLRQTVIEDFGTVADPRLSLSFETLKGCTYLQYCIKEVLRLEPPITHSMKTSARDTSLPRGGGPNGSLPLFVPKGTDIIWNTREMHRDQEYWGKDADEWRPDRWYTARPSNAYAPFNAGPRTCPGQQMGLTLAAYTIVRIVQKYERIESFDKEDVLKIATGLVGFKRGGVNVRLIPAGC